MTKKFLMATAILICLTLQSCGVMFGGSRYTATIKAKDHPNATIYVNGQKAGEGTVQGIYKRNQPLHVKLEQNNCQSTERTYYPAFRTGNFIWSVLSWGILGLGVDLGTGASYKPDHRNNSEIEKVNTKDFTFTVDYSDCN
ncbi:hypothetical protein ACG2LH_08275 [Zhouia sp. PK063]|uniref:hypothetical protein n=1 Tax=Zhouia sp. PK063 TaxID=3373602 RepID=UPI0037A728CF